jgi:thiol:disulfide interchange protein
MVWYIIIIFAALGLINMIKTEADKDSDVDDDYRDNVKRILDRVFKCLCAIVFAVVIIDIHFSFGDDKEVSQPQEISLEDISTSLKHGQSVLVIVEADWCISCKYNNFAVLGKYGLEGLLKDRNIKIIRVNWSGHDNNVLDFMSMFGKQSIPFYMIFTPKFPGGIMLSEVLNYSDVQKYIE